MDSGGRTKHPISINEIATRVNFVVMADAVCDRPHYGLSISEFKHVTLFILNRSFELLVLPRLDRLAIVRFNFGSWLN